jgi:two-component system, chemotaxis family, response regulator PixG
MTNPNIIETIDPDCIGFKDLATQLVAINQSAFSGNLTIKVDRATSWVFSFRLGRLGWVNEGDGNSIGLTQLNLAPSNLKKINSGSRKTLNSHILVGLLSDKLIERQQCTELIARVAIEYLFDIIQSSFNRDNQLSYEIESTGAQNERLNIMSPLVEIQPILKVSIQDWQQWSEDGLANYSPSWFPTIPNPSQALELFHDENLQQIILSIDGTRSLRDLAIYYQHDLHSFTKSLLPLLESKQIVLSPRSKSIAKRTDNIHEEVDSINNAKVAQEIELTRSNSQLNIACINENVFTYECLKEVFMQRGCRSFGIQDPIKVVPSLLGNKPDLIFLDLVMSTTNGYEVCKQIRRISSLKNVPVVILTSKDSLRDRTQAKDAGANGFLGKPVRSESVLEMLDKYQLVHQ